MSTFPLFMSFPTDIHSLILDQCPPNDRTCLRLTCKYLYALLPPKYPVSLVYSPKPEIFCSKPEVSHMSLQPGMSPSISIRKCGLGMQMCHDRSLAYINILRSKKRLAPLTKKRCRDTWSDHCTCFSQSGILHKQLARWMPKNMKFCSECNLFTKRKKSKKCPCTYGRAKTYSATSHIVTNLWTYEKGRGGYYHRLWNKWFTNSAFARFEARLRGTRKTNSRYNLRAYKPGSEADP